jgi:hypothetical protein
MCRTLSELRPGAGHFGLRTFAGDSRELRPEKRRSGLRGSDFKCVSSDPLVANQKSARRPDEVTLARAPIRAQRHSSRSAHSDGREQSCRRTACGSDQAKAAVNAEVNRRTDSRGSRAGRVWRANERRWEAPRRGRGLRLAVAWPGRSSGRFLASLPSCSPVHWPTSIMQPSGSRM